MLHCVEPLQQALAVAETILRDGEPTPGWAGKEVRIDMHAKWLTEAEASQLMISFSLISDREDYTRYLAHEANLVRFFLALHQQSALFVFEETTRQFAPVACVADVVQLLTLGTRELQHYILYSPVLHTIFVDTFDVASAAYVLPGEASSAALVSLHQLAQAHGLHVLH